MHCAQVTNVILCLFQQLTKNMQCIIMHLLLYVCFCIKTLTLFSLFNLTLVHKLLTYCFYHEDVGHLFLSVAVLVVFCSGLEKGVGTVRFLHLLLSLVTSIGLIHVLLELFLFSPSTRSSVSGLIPVSLAMLGMVTINSRMRKAYLLGFTVPTAAIPWLLMLIVCLFIPHTVFLCNVLAVITGQLCILFPGYCTSCH